MDLKECLLTVRFPFRAFRNFLLEGTAVYIGTLTAKSATGAPTTVQVVAIGVFEGQLLVCLPQTAWHRLSARRLLAPGSLKKGVHCEVVAGSSEDPAQAHAAYRLKVWLGLLSDSLVGEISYEEGDEPACCFKGFGPLAAVNMVPFGPALSSIASEHFAFVTAGEGGSEAPEGYGAEAAGDEHPEEEELSWEDRLTGLESGLTRMQKSIEQLLSAGKEKPPLPVSEAPLGGGVGLAKGKAVLPGLDPTVVVAARQAGIPEDQLRRMSDLAMTGAGPKSARPVTAKAKAKPRDALDESEEEAEDVSPPDGLALSDPVSQAVVTMSKILAGMQKDREKSNDLEHLLDRADGGGGEGAGGLGATRSKAAAYQKLRALLRNAPEQISASIEGLMSEDFAQVQSGPRQEATVCSARGWIEHRSHPSAVCRSDQECLVARRDCRRDQLGIPRTGQSYGLTGNRCPRPGFDRRGQLAPSFGVFSRECSPLFSIPAASHARSPGGEEDSSAGPEMGQPFHEQVEGARCLSLREAQPLRRRGLEQLGHDWRCSERGPTGSAAEATKEAEDEGRWKGRGGEVLTLLGGGFGAKTVQGVCKRVASFSSLLARRGWSPSLAGSIRRPSANPAPESRNPNPEVLSSSSPPGLSLSSAAPLTAEQSCSFSLSSPFRLSPPLCAHSGLDASVLSSSSRLSTRHATTSSFIRIEQGVVEGSLGIAGVGGPQVCSGALPATLAADAVSPGKSHLLPASEAQKLSLPSLPQESSADSPEAASVSAPGARAPTVVSSDLWSQFFDALSRADGPFSSFFHSLRLLPGAELGPTSSKEGRASRRVWPMPLPYPSLLLGGAGKVRDTLQLGCNAVVLTLNWLYLGQPRVCPGGLSLHLGSELTPKQWKAARALEHNVDVWNSAGVFGPKEMGRSASKFEVLEDLLRACQDEWASLSSSPPSQEARLKASQPTYARPVEPSRLNFPGRPSFHPVPFLDNANRQVYKDPLLFARPLAPEASLPKVRVHATRANAIRLLEVLDASGRLKLVPASELRPRLRNGVFALAKDEARDRMILDARAPNSVEDTECRWVRSLGTLEQLQFFVLPPDCNLETHTEDLREFYHSFIITHQRCLRNSLAAEFSYDQVKHLSCCPSKEGGRLVPCLATMAMGDCNAVAMGQCSHLACILRSTTLQLRDFVCLQQRPPRPGQVAAGLLIDDFILLDPVPKVPRGPAAAEGPDNPEPPGLNILKQVIAGYESAGLPRHAGKATSRSLVGEFWGGLLDGVEGRLRPHPRRTVPLAAFLVRVVAGGISSVGMLEILAGGLVSAMQLRRRLLCLLEEIYSAQRQLSRDVFVPVQGPLASELLCCAALVCQADIDLRAPGAPVVLCTDSSSSKEAAVVASVPPAFSLEASRHGLQRGLWNKLLSPLQAYLRETGELEDGEEMQGGECYDSHPLWETLCRALRFRALGPVRSRDRRVHINIGEVRAAIFGEERVGMLHGACRYIHLQDSQVSLACFVKGRSCSPSINKELRRSVPFHLSHGVRPSFGFIRSRFNPSDDPTRGVDLRQPDIELPPWLRDAFEGRFAEFDRFLSEHGVHPSQLTGLPDEAELLPDGPVDLRCPREIRANRRSQGPEVFAKHLLGLSHVKPSDGLALFRRLPKETPSRESQPRSQACSFAAGVFVHGGVLGLRRTCWEYPESVRVFTQLIRAACPELRFSSFSVNQNVETLPHTDSHNADWEPNCVIALSSFKKGGIWTEVQGGTQPRLHKGRQRFGEVLDLSAGPKLLDPKRLHATEGWRGTRVVLIAYTVRSLEKLSEEQRGIAEALGFKLPRPAQPGTETQAIAEAPKSPSLLSAVRPASLPSGAELKSRASSFGHRFDPLNLCGGSLRVEPAPPLPFPGSASLSSAVLDLLNSFPPGRFLYASVFPDLATAFRSGPGWLDLFSGFRGFGKGLVALAPCWVLCLDVAHDWSKNLLGSELQDQLIWLIEEGAFKGFSAGSPSGSFSSAAGRAFRTPEHPQGRPGLSVESFSKVQTDNDLLSFLVGLVALATELGLVYLIENPRHSWIWKQAVWGFDNQGDFLVDMCVFGTRWKKATRVRTNGSLKGKRMLCGCNAGAQSPPRKGQNYRCLVDKALRGLSAPLRSFACKRQCQRCWLVGRSQTS